MNETTAMAAVKKWDEAIQKQVSGGKTRAEAISELAYTDLHQSYLQAWNFLNGFKKYG